MPYYTPRPLASSLEGSRVLELGAGKTGLAGLGLAACSGAMNVVITDGNPDALRNLEVCFVLCTPRSVHLFIPFSLGGGGCFRLN